MSLDKMLCPSQRKWISELIHLEAHAAELRSVSEGFMLPIHQAAPYILEHEKKQAIKNANAKDLAKIQADKIKKKLFQPKKKKSKKKSKKRKDSKKRNESSSESELEEEEFENGYEIANDVDELQDDDEGDWTTCSESSSSSSTDDSDDDRPRYLRKYNKGLDEIFIFHSDESDVENEKDKEEAPNKEIVQTVAAQSDDSDVETDKEKAAMDAQESNPAPTAAPDSEDKETREFDLFHKYALELNAASSQDSADDLVPLKYILMGQKAASSKLGNTKIKLLAKETSPHLSTTVGEVIVDNPIIQGAELPLLAGPIPKEAVGYGAISLYTGLSDEPGRFQWKMSHVVELLTNQLRPRMQFDPTAQIVHDGALNNDFILTVTMYHAYEQPEGDPSIDTKTVQEPEFAFQIEILGSQTVKDLTKMLRCQNDLYCTREYQRPDADLFTTASKAFETCKKDLSMTKNPEFLLLLNDTVYSYPEAEKALRIEGRLNLKWLLNWTNRHSDDFGEMKPGHTSTQIKDLKLRLGFPYVYSHQECCEHLIVFNSIRLPRVEDQTTFPLYKRLGKHPIKYCTVDNDCIARWSIVGCERLPQDPMFLCQECVKMYCYQRAKPFKRIGEFKMYPFLQLVHYL